MNKKIGILSLAVLTVLAVTASTAMAATNSVKSGQAANKTKNEIRQRSANLTDAQKAEMKTKMEARQSEMKVKRAAVQAAISSGDYDAWVIAQKAINANCPLLSKVTKANFNRYIESVKLRQQADVIDQELGIESGFGQPGGAGFGFGLGRGHGCGQGIAAN